MAAASTSTLSQQQEDRPFQYCSPEECKERQELGQVSVLEATVENCCLPQAQRRLDPRYAVPKYRRSAAGGGVYYAEESSKRRDSVQLTTTLLHLIQIAAFHRASPAHPRVQDATTVIRFLVDRCRACQADATRLLSGSDDNATVVDTVKHIRGHAVPATWHLRLARLLIWIRFCWDFGSSTNNGTNNQDSLTPQTMFTMLSTAMGMYWEMREFNRGDDYPCQQSNDDEILCYSAMTTIGMNSSSPVSWNGLLLEFNRCQKQLQASRKGKMPIFPSSSYPLWGLAMKVASHASRQDFTPIFQFQSTLTKQLTVLAKCCCAPALFPWRYCTVQQYNVSFAKGEAVVDMDRLLGIDPKDWTLELAKALGAPVSVVDSKEGKDGGKKIAITMKSVSIPDLDVKAILLDQSKASVKSTSRWVLGELFDVNEEMGISACEILRLLGSDTVLSPVQNVKNNKSSKEPELSSLQRQVAAMTISGVRPLSQQGRGGNSDPGQGKRRARCKFFAKGECRYGDRCRFEHSL